MTQVVTVSQATAAYASEAYKPRSPKYSPMEMAISEWHARAVESASAFDRGLLNVVRPPSLQLAFLTSHPAEEYRAVSVEQAVAEYASYEGPDSSVENASAPVGPQSAAMPEPAVASTPEPVVTTGSSE